MKRPKPHAHCSSCGSMIGPDHDNYCLSYQWNQRWERHPFIIPIFLVSCLICFLILLCIC